MDALPTSILKVAEIRELERRACEALRIPSYTLMTRAAEASLKALRACWPAARCLTIVCGPGNNGADGYVLARLAREQQFQVRTVWVAPPESLRADAARAYADLQASAGDVQPWSAAAIEDADVIVDAILGTGVSRHVDVHLIEVFRAINAARAPVFSLDIPSGLHADSGRVMGGAIMAERTLSFIGLKLGFYVGEGPNHTGIVMFDGLGVPSSLHATVRAAAQRLEAPALAGWLPARDRTSHKGQHGHVLVVGGGLGMAGAARLAGEAALRAGAGLVTVATHPENVAAITAGRPELICRGVASGSELGGMIEACDVLAIGPGLGRDDWGQIMFRAALASDRPAVVDADGLNLLAQAPAARDSWILTPHPGEAGRLLGIGAADVQRDRIAAARALVDRYGGTVVLKGAGSLVMHGDLLPFICDRGNPGMASPGMGDVLTGVVAALLAQIGHPQVAACAGVLVHAMAGDMAARLGERGLIASDLFAHLPTCVNPTQRS